MLFAQPYVDSGVLVVKQFLLLKSLLSTFLFLCWMEADVGSCTLCTNE